LVLPEGWTEARSWGSLGRAEEAGAVVRRVAELLKVMRVSWSSLARQAAACWTARERMANLRSAALGRTSASSFMEELASRRKRVLMPEEVGGWLARGERSSRESEGVGVGEDEEAGAVVADGAVEGVGGGGGEWEY
jgi:hypothetical protein